MRFEEIGPDEAKRLIRAADAGVAELARELEFLGLSNQDESLAHARNLRLMILVMQETDRSLREGPPPAGWLPPTSRARP